MEPYRLRRWTRSGNAEKLNFYTCARPGRSKGKTGQIDNALVRKWARKLPDVPNSTIVSLLGRKPLPTDQSEFSFYSFCGGWDTPDERGCKPTFQQWLTQHEPTLKLEIVEHPTLDFTPIPAESLAAIAEDVNQLLAAGRTVVLVDSGGEQRSGQVRKHLGFVEDSKSL